MEEIPVMMKNYVKCIGESLVKEYLHSKGLESTLRCMSLEYPEKEVHLYSRRELANEFGVQELLNAANRNLVNPQKTVLEIILSEMIRKNDSTSRCALSNTRYVDRSPLSSSYDVSKQCSLVEHSVDLKQVKEFKNDSQRFFKSSYLNVGMVNTSNVQAKLTNRINRVRPGLEAIKYFLSSVAKGKL